MKRISLAASLLAACATQPTEPSAIEPALGHYQPQPTEPSESDPETEQAERPSEEAPVGEWAMPTAEEESLCLHIVAIVQSESTDRATPEQTEELLASCSLALAHDRKRIGTEEFDRRAACMVKATTVAGFSVCAPADEDP